MNEETQKMYFDIGMKCVYKCPQYVKMKDLEYHESICQLPKCKNFDKCHGYEQFELGGIRSCSKKCHDSIKNNTTGEIKETDNHFPISFSKKGPFRLTNNIISLQ